jgi:hypothetical protein
VISASLKAFTAITRMVFISAVNTFRKCHLKRAKNRVNYRVKMSHGNQLFFFVLTAARARPHKMGLVHSPQFLGFPQENILNHVKDIPVMFFIGNITI